MFRLFRKGLLRRYLRFNAIRRGLFGRSPFWLTVLGAGVIGRGLGKLTKSGEAPVLFSEDLAQGQAYAVHHLPPPETRRQRRRRRRTERRTR